MRILKKLTLFAAICGIMTLCSFSVSAAEIYSHYTVTNGDTVYKIAQEHNITMDAIINANGLTDGGELIYPNMVLLLDSNAKNNDNYNYTVKSGDSIFKIAQSYGITTTELKTANNLTADRIYCGQLLYVPGTAETVPVMKEENVNESALTEAEIYMIAKMIYGEARGECYQGQVAVGAVIMNRLYSPDFPDTVYEVLFQDSQFSAIDDGQYYLTPDDSAISAAYEAVNGADPTGGALFYWNPVKAPNNAFLNAKPIIATIGNHVFAK